MKYIYTVAQLPAPPIISRFVAPWDASSWYYVRGGFGTGSRLYSNTNLCAQTVPSCLTGGDYIVSFDSFADGFDDKQGASFFTECDAHVFIALPVAQSADFLQGFQATKAMMTAEDGSEYRIYQAQYPAQSHVSLPPFNGACHHYVPVICRANHADAGVAPCPAIPYRSAVTVTHCPQARQWYVHEAFNRISVKALAAFFNGDCELITDPNDAQRKLLCVSNGAELVKTVETTARDLLEIILRVPRGAAELTWCGVSISLSGRRVAHAGNTLAESMNDTFALRFVRTGKRCEVWVNSRLREVLPCHDDRLADFRLSADAGGCAMLDVFSLRDQTDVPLVEETFSELPQALLTEADTLTEIQAYPFADSHALYMQSAGKAAASYAFAAVSGQIHIETVVKPMRDTFTILAEARDSLGRLALRIAMYRHNLYVSHGEQWVRIFDGHISGMYYPSRAWYHLSVRINLADGTFDFLLDGAYRARWFPLVEHTVDIAQIGFLGDMYIRSIKIYDHLTYSRGMLPAAAVLDVRDAPYCAAGDGKTLDTAAIQQALDDAAYTGATVLLRDGVFVSGALFLRSDTTVWVDNGATLQGVQDHTLYPLFEPCDSLCAHRQLGRGLLCGDHIQNVRITGGGVVDGNGRYHFKMNDPLHDRERNARPDQLYIACSSNIVVDDVHFTNAAFWSLVPLSCRNLLFEHLNVDCMNTPNRDGIDPVDCIDMTIRNCRVVAGDDGICLKSSDTMGCSNIHIEDVWVQSLASAIKLGTDSYQAFTNISATRCFIKNTNRCGVAIESVDGAQIKNLHFSHLDMAHVGAPAYIVLGHRKRRPTGLRDGRMGSVHGIVFEDIYFSDAYAFSHAGRLHATMIVGDSLKHRIGDVRFTHCRWTLPGGGQTHIEPPQPLNEGYPEYNRHGAASGYAFSLRYAHDIILTDCRVVLLQPDARPAVMAFDCERIHVSHSL